MMWGLSQHHIRLKISVFQGTESGSHAPVPSGRCLQHIIFTNSLLQHISTSARESVLNHSLLPRCSFSTCLPRSFIMALANHETTSPPSNATDAVLKPSEPVPEGSREVQGIDFNDYADMGFQATAVGEAVRIVNDMVSGTHRPQATVALGREPLGLRLRETPAIPAHLRVGETI
jgi:hypothetical protein